MGYYCVSNAGSDFAPLFVQDLKVAVSAQVGKAGQHYCPAVFFEKKLSDAYVESLPCFWVDVDVPENYASFDEAVSVWSEKLAGARVPPPTKIVSSGAGVHLYWYFEEGQRDIKDWLIVRDGLIKLFIDHELRGDFAHTHPSAYMRTMGSINEKTGTVVKVVKSNDKVSFASLMVVCADYLQGGKKSGTLAPKRVFQGEAPDWGVIRERCEALREASEPVNQGSVPESLWRALLSIVYVCQNGDQLIHEVSREHPGYEPMKTVAKATGTIPYTCQKIRECGGRCGSCPHVVKTPLQLAKSSEPVALTGGKKVLDEQGRVSVQVGRFTVNENGISTIDKGGEAVAVSSIPIYVGDVVENTAGRVTAGCYLEWDNAQGKKRSEYLPFATLVSLNDFMAWLGDRNLANKVLSPKAMILYVLEGSSFKEKVALRTGASRYGWQDGNLILPYGKVTPDGVEKAYLIGDLPQDVKKPEGVPRGCLEMVFKHFLSKNKGYLVAPMMMNVVAPLFPLLGINPVVMYLSGMSGSGKSTVGYAGSCMYGFTDKYNMAEGSTTMNSLMDKMSSLNCIPLTLDEVSLGRRTDVREIIMQAVNGRPKGRLTKNAKQNTRDEWWTPLFITSNATYSGCMGDDLDTAQGVRVAELSMLESLRIPSSDIARMRDELVDDGANIAVYIVKHKVELMESVQKIMDLITADDRYDPSMRFLASTWATIKCGLKIILDLYPSIFKDILNVMPTLEDRILWSKMPRGSLEVIDNAVNSWINDNNDKIAVWNNRMGCANEDKIRQACARYSSEEDLMYIKVSTINDIIKGVNESMAAFNAWAEAKCTDGGQARKMRLTGRSNPVLVVGYKMEKSYLCD